MIVGETLIARHQESSDTLFTLALNEVALAIINPVGASVNPGAISVIPGSSSLTQEVDASFAAALAGPYTLTWTITIGSSILKRPEVYFASWTDIYSYMRSLLQYTNAEFPDGIIDQQIAYVAQTIIDSFLGLETAGGYSGLLGLDRSRFDQALALFTAACVRRYSKTTSAIGELQEFRADSLTFRFATPPARALTPIEGDWIDEGWLVLGRVTAVKDAFAANANDFGYFVVSGPTRNSIAAGATETAFSPLARLLSDTYYVPETL